MCYTINYFAWKNSTYQYNKMSRETLKHPRVWSNFILTPKMFTFYEIKTRILFLKRSV